MLVFLLLVAAAPTFAGPREDHRQLQELLQDAAKAPSDAATCDSFLAPATSAAQSLATASCSSGYTVSGVHGVLIAIRGLLKVGNVCLHRHGCKDEARAALRAAREILLSTPGLCMSGNEMQAQIAGLNEAFLAASGLDNSVPASNPDLYPPPPGAPAPSNHCIDESPDLAQVYSVARAWADDNPFSGINPGAMPGGSVSCDSGDPTNVWRAEVPGKDGGTDLPAVTVYVNISDWTASN